MKFRSSGFNRIALGMVAASLFALTSCRLGSSVEPYDDISQEMTLNGINVSSLQPSSDTKSCGNFVSNVIERDVKKAYIFINQIKICWGEGKDPNSKLRLSEATLTVPAGVFTKYTGTLDDSELAYALDTDPATNAYCPNCTASIPTFSGGIIQPTTSVVNGQTVTSSACAVMKIHAPPLTCGRLSFGGLAFAGAQPGDPPPASVYEIGTLTFKGEVEEGFDVRQIEGSSELIISY